MTMAVYGGVAVVGQAVKSDKTAMIIRIFMVVLVRRFHCTMSVKGEWCQLGKIHGFSP